MAEKLPPGHYLGVVGPVLLPREQSVQDAPQDALLQVVLPADDIALGADAAEEVLVHLLGAGRARQVGQLQVYWAAWQAGTGTCGGRRAKGGQGTEVQAPGMPRNAPS